MDWQAALRARLLVDPAFIVAAGSRVTWEDRVQGDPLDAVTLLDVTADLQQDLEGFQGLQRARVQVDVWAKTYARKQALTGIVVTALVPPHSGNGIAFTRAMIEGGPRDLSERDGEQKIFRKTMDLIVHHRAT